MIRARPLSELSLPPRGAKEVFWATVSTVGPATALPVLAVSGRRPGPVCICAGGIHGDEFEGPLAIQRVFSRLEPTLLAGSFVGLPICNPAAFEHQGRESPPSVDGLNLARVFPGRRDGRPTERLAADLFDFVVRLAGDGGFVVDLHSGGTRYTYLPLAGFRDVTGPARAASEDLVRHFGIPRIWLIPDQPGPLNAATARHGIPTVGTEATGRGGALAEDVDAFAGGVMRLLVHRGLYEGPRPQPEPGPTRRTSQILADTDGLWITACGLGEQVTPGSVLGRILGPLGEVRSEISSAVSGEVWALRTFVSIRAGDIACLVAHGN